MKKLFDVKIISSNDQGRRQIYQSFTARKIIRISGQPQLDKVVIEKGYWNKSLRANPGSKKQHNGEILLYSWCCVFIIHHTNDVHQYKQLPLSFVLIHTSHSATSPSIIFSPLTCHLFLVLSGSDGGDYFVFFSVDVAAPSAAHFLPFNLNFFS
jgi:hypothetical protein